MKNKKKLEYVVERGIDWDLNSAKSFVPDWYKKASRTFDGEISLLKQNKTIKYCTPFLDALISGYMLETTCDIEVVRDGDYSIMNWVHTDQPEVIGNRNDSVLSTFERGSEYTLDNFFCSSKEIPNFSKVFKISGSTSSKEFNFFFFFGLE